MWQPKTNQGSDAPRIRSIEDLPHLSRWLATREADQDPCALLLRSLTSALAKANTERADTLVSGIQLFLDSASNPLQDFLQADEILAADNYPLANFLSDLFETTVKSVSANKLFPIGKNLADVVPLTALRFLSAWLAFQAGKYSDCLDECEQITEPYASVYSLAGQASLETGDVFDAIDALKIAVSLDEQDALARFQLVKALYVSGAQHEAWTAADELAQLTGANLEVDTMRAFIALASPRELERVTEAWQALSTSCQDQPLHPTLALLLFELSFAMNDPTATEQVIRGLDRQTVMNDRDFRANLPNLLKKIGSFGKPELSVLMIDQILDAAS